MKQKGVGSRVYDLFIEQQKGVGSRVYDLFIEQ